MWGAAALCIARHIVGTWSNGSPPRSSFTQITSPLLCCKPVWTAAADPPGGAVANDDDLGITPGQLVGDLDRGVRRAVVDDDQLERTGELRQHFEDLFHLGVQCRLRIADGQEDTERAFQGRISLMGGTCGYA